MNQSMQHVVEFFKPIAKLSHQQQVMRLYRSALRNCMSWAENRDVFNDEAIKIREEFNRNMQANPAQSARLVREGYVLLDSKKHPDPYINPHMPGGSKFMRNPAVPLEVVYPNGIPSWESKRRMNIDMSNIPDDQPYADKAFVDSISKSYWIDK